MSTMTTCPDREANKRCTSSQDGHKQLIPGIPNEITLFQIFPKLPWKTFYILSSVSRSWLQGIRARQVYNARVLSHSAETLSIVCYRFEQMSFTVKEDFWEEGLSVALCSKKDHSLTMLPPIPYFGDDRQWVSLDAKIYLVGGQNLELEGEGEDGQLIYRRDGRCSNKVFVFDLAGQGQWKECASMNEPRNDFGCGVMHGKLYVFGGMPGKSYYETPTTSCGSEVYDPEEDSWSPIRSMTTLRYAHRIEAVGDELFVLGGCFYDPDCSDYEEDSSDEDDTLEESQLNRWEHRLRGADFLEVYHPSKDEWRVMNPYGKDDFNHFLFVAQGKLYSMDWSSIDLYDAKDNAWTHLHSFSIPFTSPADSVIGTKRIKAVVAIDDELAVRAEWYRRDNEKHYSRDFQSIGFCNESKEIILQQTQFPSEEVMWQRSLFPIFVSIFPDSSNRLIQL